MIATPEAIPPLAQVHWALVVPNLVLAAFIFAFGAVVGSFINVVIYRVPAGMSVISPPSRCPTCGARLVWWENFPILGWFFVRGRCRHCKVRISPQYMTIELLMGLLFTGLFLAYYVAGPRVAWWGAIGGRWWYYTELLESSPMFACHLALLAGLVAMTMIDARTFTIPIQIPLVVTLVAFAGHAVQALIPPVAAVASDWPVPATTWRWSMVTGGGMLGVGLSTLLLRAGVLRYSFADYEEYVKPDEVLGEYPHARREMVVEIVFLVPAIVGMAVGWAVGGRLPATPPPMIVQALGGTFAGYLVGGGLVWTVRILGSLAFGREAMGAGDIHLMAAIGAVLGCTASVFAFFAAPFSGLLWIAVSKGLITVFRTRRRELPFGPHLAVAAVGVIVCAAAIDYVFANYPVGYVLPEPGRVVTPPAGP